LVAMFPNLQGCWETGQKKKEKTIGQFDRGVRIDPNCKKKETLTHGSGQGRRRGGGGGKAKGKKRNTVLPDANFQGRSSSFYGCLGEEGGSMGGRAKRAKRKKFKMGGGGQEF